MELIQKYYLPWHFPFRKEFAGIAIILIIFLAFPRLIRRIDHSAAPIDPGVFSAVILAISAMLIFQAVTWWVMKSIWPVFACYSENQFEGNFKSLPPAHKVIIYLSFYLFIMISFAGVFAAIV